MSDRTTIFVTGQVYWAKIFGPPRDNYERTGKEWSYDFMPDDTAFLKDHKLLDRLKEDSRGNIPNEYIRLKKPEFTKDGDRNEHIRVYDSENEPWDSDKLLGNGTRVVVKLVVVDYGKGKKKGIYTTAIRVEELVPFVSNEFGGYDGDNPKAKDPDADAKPSGRQGKAKPPGKTILEDLDDLDDDSPF